MSVSIGVLREAAEDETRVALTPTVVAILTRDGHTVTVEKGAGERAGFPDAEYEQAGAAVAPPSVPPAPAPPATAEPEPAEGEGNTQ